VRTVSFDVVVPTIGRASLGRLLAALASSSGPLPGRILLVADGAENAERFVGAAPRTLVTRLELLRRPGFGPAAARNVGWRASRADWVAFLDDDVVPDPDWLERLQDDLRGLPQEVAGSQGRVRVPLPSHRRPTEWERTVKGLETAAWITADLAFRRSALMDVGGFDERFPRAFREDADLALRLQRACYRLVRGRRRVTHPVGGERLLDRIRREAGNADDVLMTALHGPDWYEHAAAPRGRVRRHLATTAAGLAALAAVAGHRPRLAKASAAGWLAGTAELAWSRLAPGPRTADEMTRLVLTSMLIPAAASYQRLVGHVRKRQLLRGAFPDAVLLDRDGTLVLDVPYNGEPERVVPVGDARAALDRLRAAGIPLGVVSNQSGVARGLLTPAQVTAVNRQVDELLGPFQSWAVCLHGPEDGCRCRKPEPGLVVQAARELGAEPTRSVVIGDIGADVEAARAAGARAILVPSPATRAEEVRAAPEVAPTLTAAVDRLLGESL
jgi:histidinol-phosphate phosphatase family protein